MEFLDVATIVGAAAKWLIYSGLLWAMIKIQKLNCHVGGLFASSLAAILVGFIPLVGSYLSYVVLVICLWKCTGADIAPDIIFTVGIAGALMFCVNLWVIGMLMGHLRPDLAQAHTAGDAGEMAAETEEEGEDAPTASPQATNSTGRSTGPTVVAARSPASRERVAPAPQTVAGGPLTIKGIFRAGSRTSVLISDGTQVHTVSRGDSFTAQLPDEGRTRLRCEDITQDFVVLTRGGGRIFQLRLP